MILKDPDGIDIMWLRGALIKALLSFVAFLVSGYGEPILQYVLLI